MSSRDNIGTKLLWGAMVQAGVRTTVLLEPWVSTNQPRKSSVILTSPLIHNLSNALERCLDAVLSHSYTLVQLHYSMLTSLWSASLALGFWSFPAVQCLPCCCGLPSSFKPPQQLLILLLPSLLLLKVCVHFLFGCNLLPWGFLNVRTLPSCTNPSFLPLFFVSFFFAIFLSYF